MIVSETRSRDKVHFVRLSKFMMAVIKGYKYTTRLFTTKLKLEALSKLVTEIDNCAGTLQTLEPVSSENIVAGLCGQSILEDKYTEAKAMCPMAANLSLSFVGGIDSVGPDSIGAEVNDSTFSDLTINESITESDTLALINDTTILL